MAHLWVANPEGDWTASDLEEEEVLVRSSTAGGGSADDSVRIRRCGPTDGRQWALISPIRSMIRVNGRSVPGVRVLADRGELFVPLRGRLFFSTERLAGAPGVSLVVRGVTTIVLGEGCSGGPCFLKRVVLVTIEDQCNWTTSIHPGIN